MKKCLILLFLACLSPVWGAFFFQGRSHTAKNFSDSFLEGSLLIHLEESRLANGMTVEKAMEMAKSAGTTVSLTLGDLATIDKYRERIWALLENYTDVLFVTPEEVYALTRLPLEQALPFLKNFCPVVIVKE